MYWKYQEEYYKMNQDKTLNAIGKGECVYDYRYDTLTFRIRDRNYKHSFEFQNFVIDIDKENYVTGIRIFDISRVSGMNKIIFRNIVSSEFRASIKDNVITVVFKFAGKIRNKVIPLFSEKQNFTQQITVPGNPRHPLRNSEVVAPDISAS